MSICRDDARWNMYGIAGSSSRCAACPRRRPPRSSTARSAPGSRPYLNRLPTGSSPGQNRRAISSLITTTGGAPWREIASSTSVRPRSTRDAHRLEVPGHDVVFGQRRRRIVRPARRLTLERDAVVGLSMDEEVADRARRPPRRAARESRRDRLGEERGPLLAGCRSVRGQIDLQQQHVARIEAAAQSTARARSCESAARRPPAA